MSVACFAWCWSRDACGGRSKPQAIVTDFEEENPDMEVSPCRPRQLHFSREWKLKRQLSADLNAAAARARAGSAGKWQARVAAVAFGCFGCLIPFALVLHEFLLNEVEVESDASDWKPWLVSGFVLVSSCIVSRSTPSASRDSSDADAAPKSKEWLRRSLVDATAYGEHVCEKKEEAASLCCADCSVHIPADIDSSKKQVLQRFREVFDHTKCPKDGCLGHLNDKQSDAVVDLAKAFSGHLWMDRKSKSEPEVYPEDRLKLDSFRQRLQLVGATVSPPEDRSVAQSCVSSEAVTATRKRALARVDGLLSSDASLLRYLKARNYDEKAAAELYERTQTWRAEVMPHEMCCPSCAKDPEGHDMKIVGLDAHAHPVIYGSIARATNCEAEAKVIHTVCTFEKALEVSALLAEAGVAKDNHKFCVVVNLNHFSMKDAMDTTSGILMARIMGTHYPECLYKWIVVDPPRILDMFMNVMKKVLPKQTVDKVEFVKSGSTGEGLSKLVPVLGGEMTEWLKKQVQAEKAMKPVKASSKSYTEVDLRQDI